MKISNFLIKSLMSLPTVGRVSPQGVTRQTEANMSGYAALTRPKSHEETTA